MFMFTNGVHVNQGVYLDIHPSLRVNLTLYLAPVEPITKCRSNMGRV